MAELSPELKRYSELDRRLVETVKDVKMLSTLSWPSGVQREFLDNWHRGNFKLPEVQYKTFDFSEKRTELDQIILRSDPDHPIGDYLLRTAQSWRYATLLLENLGKPDMTEYAVQLYGKPGDSIAGSPVNNIDAARHFIIAANEIMADVRLAEPEYCLSAQTLKDEMEATLNKFFWKHTIKVEIDPNLVAKAAAGPTRVRLRDGTSFSEYDRLQLLEHEAFVHSLTALNGRDQPHLRSLGLNSPRITATQEGLAVFAELVTGSIDIGRMKRISLRIIAIDLALNGADFLDVFRFFMDEGQSESDSFNSAMRVFRGAPLTGGHAFTKDTVYLTGMLSVHTFFRWALKQGKLLLTRHLFAGKMTLHDVIAFEPFVDSGFIAEPTYLPPWAQRSNALAGYLSFSLFANRIRLDSIEQRDLKLGV